MSRDRACDRLGLPIRGTGGYAPQADAFPEARKNTWCCSGNLQYGQGLSRCGGHELVGILDASDQRVDAAAVVQAGLADRQRRLPA